MIPSTSLRDPEAWEAIDTLLALRELDRLQSHVRGGLRLLQLLALLESRRWTIDALAGHTGISRSAVHRHLRALVKAGYAVHDRGNGYRAVVHEEAER
jgi:biotin operon repressor